MQRSHPGWRQGFWSKIPKLGETQLSKRVVRTETSKERQRFWFAFSNSAMPSASDTAYPRLKTNPSATELGEIYAPNIWLFSSLAASVRLGNRIPSRTAKRPAPLEQQGGEDSGYKQRELLSFTLRSRGAATSRNSLEEVHWKAA
jgi:hypothetical protein